MPPNAQRHRDTRPISMRSSSVYSDRGKTTTTMVHCPITESMHDIKTCLTCSGYAGVSYGVSTGKHNADVLCRGSAALEPTRQAAVTAADQTEVWTIMPPEVFCVRAEVTIETVLSILLEKNISGLPVVDDAGLPIGVISKTDIVRRMYEARPLVTSRLRVSDLMSPKAFTLPTSATVSEAAALMAIEGVHRIPIVTKSGEVIGNLSALDVVQWLANNDGYLR